MKKITSLLLIIFVAAQIATAQEFTVKSFVFDASDISARVTSFKDKNKQNCAMIKVQTNLTGLVFDCGQGFCTDIAYDGAGEYRLYVSPGEQVLKIKKEGLLPLTYPIEIPIGELNTYIMILTGSGGVVDNTTVKSDFVKIYSTPEGADLYFDGVLIGVTPYEQLYKEGMYSYRIDKNMYYWDEGMITVKAGQTKEIDATLKPKFGNFTINSTPSGADITINSTATGQKTPATFEFYDPASYTVSVSKYLYQDTEQTFTLAEGDNKNIAITLPADFAGITIKTTPETGAAITLDNKDMNVKTPYTFDQLESGEHTVRVTLPMYKPKEETFTVTAGTSKTVTITMSPTFAEVNITALPDADIYIDKTFKKNNTCTEKLNEGLHEIVIKKEKYIEQTHNITVVAGEPQTLSYTLLPKLGNIAITTTPTKADVYIDNVKKGTSPLVLYDLLIGDYAVTAKLTDYADETKTLTVKEGTTEQSAITLSNGTPEISFVGIEIFDSGEGTGAIYCDKKLQAGEMVKVKITVQNIGNNTALNSKAEITCSDLNIYIGTVNFDLGDIEVGVTKEIWCTISPNKRVTTTDNLPIYLTVTEKNSKGNLTNYNIPLKLNK